jgi:plastocyanin
MPMPMQPSVGVVAAVFIGLLACGEASPQAEPPVRVVAVANLTFGPTPTSVHVNDVVEWRNADIFRHTATAKDGSFDVDLPPGAKGRTTMRRAGVFIYICRFHPGMTARLEVAP